MCSRLALFQTLSSECPSLCSVRVCATYYLLYSRVSRISLHPIVGVCVFSFFFGGEHANTMVDPEVYPRKTHVCWESFQCAEARPPFKKDT